MYVFFSWFGWPGTIVLSLLLSVLALVLAVWRPSLIRWTCFGAMGLSSIGDIFLARPEGLEALFPHYFIIGASFFMAAHLVYIVCYRMKLREVKAPFWNGSSLAVSILGAVTTLGIALLCFSKGTMSTLPLVVLYAAIVFFNCATVFSYACSKKFRGPSALSAVVGVSFFLLSDLIIGLGIAANIHAYDRLIWWLYPLGQALLILGASTEKQSGT